jgi:hypothetical protein
LKLEKAARIGELGQKVIENPEFPQPKVNKTDRLKYFLISISNKGKLLIILGDIHM